MSDYIMHSSGTWKNHKWIRREGSPGNYKYYYKNSDSDSSSSSKKYTDDPDYNPSTPYTNQYKDKNGKKHGASTGSGTADTARDTAHATARISNYYVNERFDAKKRARDIADLKRRAMGDQYRRDQVNRMINAMSGKTVTSVVNAPARRKTNLRTNQYERSEAEGLYGYKKSNQNPTRVGEKGSRSHYLKTQETPKQRQRTADEYFTALRAQVREKKATERANRRNKK